jgi:hypothetical protein
MINDLMHILYMNVIYKAAQQHMHSKKNNRRQTKRRRSKRGKRGKRNTKRNGGMHRVLSATGRIVGQVMGKGPDRVEKIGQILKTTVESATKSYQTPEKFKPAVLARQFSASPSSPFRMVSETPRRKYHNANDDFKTPNKDASSSNATPPKLGTRVRRPRETPEERRRRLGFSVAPTIENPTSVVGELFP